MICDFIPAPTALCRRRQSDIAKYIYKARRARIVQCINAAPFGCIALILAGMPSAAQLDADCLHMCLQWQPLDECALTIDEYTCMMYGAVSPALDTFGFEYRPCAAANGGA